MLITKASIEALFSGFSGQFRAAYDNTPTYSQRFSTTIQSSAKIETYGWMTRIPKMREWVGPRVVNNLNTEAYTLRNRTFEETVGVDVDDIADDTLGVYAPIMSELGRASSKLRDQLIKEAMQAGTSATSFDGVAFFATTHPLNPAGNQSNYYSSAKALTGPNFDDVRTAMRSLTGNDGEPLGVDPRLLIVPPALEKEALEIVAAERNSSGATNVLRGTAEVLVVPEFANEPTAWYLADVSKGIMPLIYQQRMAPETTLKNSPTDDNVFLDNQMLMGVKARGAAGYGLWWLIAKAVG